MARPGLTCAFSNRMMTAPPLTSGRLRIRISAVRHTHIRDGDVLSPRRTREMRQRAWMACWARAGRCRAERAGLSAKFANRPQFHTAS